MVEIDEESERIPSANKLIEKDVVVGYQEHKWVTVAIFFDLLHK